MNDSPKGNCQMKKTIINQQPYLCLYARRDIEIGEELRYDYGVSDLPWRIKVCIKVYTGYDSKSPEGMMITTLTRDMPRHFSFGCVLHTFNQV